MHKILSVGLGGFFGATCRYISITLTARMVGERFFPYGTMLVNMAGCFLIGLGLGIATSREFLSPEARLFVFTGFLGSFTTYSTFAYESFALARDGGFVASVANIILHIVFGLTAVWAGDAVSRMM